MTDAQEHPPSIPGACPDGPYLDRLGGMPDSLVFIMGAHRSGTSMLYHLLASTDQFDYVSAYDIVHYDRLLFNRTEGREDGSKRALDEQIDSQNGGRLIDGLPVAADLPEEYRFILFKERVNPLLQRRTVLFSPHLTERSRDRFVELCRKKAYLADAHKPLLLKNPNDFYRNFLTIRRFFPQAKFIFIHRHPIHVFDSNMRAWSLALREKSHYLALLDADYARLFRPVSMERFLRARLLNSGLGRRRILSGLISGYAYYLENVERLPPGSWISIRYEDLCRDPSAYVSQIGRWLGKELFPTRAGPLIEPRKPQVAAEVRACYEKKLDALMPYLRDQRYPPFPEAGRNMAAPARAAEICIDG